jgi:hypothetical protein
MQPLMHELLLDHARQKNEAHVKKAQVELHLRPVKPQRSGLRVRFLLSLSNALLTTGYRIRPKEATQCC